MLDCILVSGCNSPPSLFHTVSVRFWVSHAHFFCVSIITRTPAAWWPWRTPSAEWTGPAAWSSSPPRTSWGPAGRSGRRGCPWRCTPSTAGSQPCRWIRTFMFSVTRGFRSKSARKKFRIRKIPNKEPLKSAYFADLLNKNFLKKSARDLQNPQVLRKKAKSGHTVHVQITTFQQKFWMIVLVFFLVSPTIPNFL